MNLYWVNSDSPHIVMCHLVLNLRVSFFETKSTLKGTQTICTTCGFRLVTANLYTPSTLIVLPSLFSFGKGRPHEVWTRHQEERTNRKKDRKKGKKRKPVWEDLNKRRQKNIALSAGAVVAAGVAGTHHAGRKSVCETPGENLYRAAKCLGRPRHFGWKSDHWDGESKCKMMEASPKSLLAVLPQSAGSQ